MMFWAFLTRFPAFLLKDILMSVMYTPSIQVSVMSVWSQLLWVHYVSMDREHLRLLFKYDLSQIMSII